MIIFSQQILEREIKNEKLLLNRARIDCQLSRNGDCANQLTFPKTLQNFGFSEKHEKNEFTVNGF
jgi:hypothetical protein